MTNPTVKEIILHVHAIVRWLKISGIIAVSLEVLEKMPWH